MKTVLRRVRRLEDQFGSSDRPRRHLRMVIGMAGAKPCLEDATCERALCSDGTLLEMVEFGKHNEGPDDLTDEELDRWVGSFPIEGVEARVVELKRAAEMSAFGRAR